jgi:hypothetical protein
VRKGSKLTVKPTYFTVVKGYGQVAEPLKLTISTPTFLHAVEPEICVPSTAVVTIVKPTYSLFA